MNERIRELWEQASIRYSVYEMLKPQDERKIIPDIFAELIVEEMYDFIMDESASDNGIPDLGKIKQHFGVEE